MIRQYTYAYTAVCPEAGESYSLTLPYANTLCMNLFMEGFSEEFHAYRIVMAMDKASWHTGEKTKKRENIVPLFQPSHSPEVNPVENLWHHIREKGGFKNRTFESLKDVEDTLAEQLKNLDKETVKSVCLYHWIKEAL